MSDNGARFFPSRLPWLVWRAGVYDCWVSKVALVTNTATSAFSNILLHSVGLVAETYCHSAVYVEVHLSTGRKGGAYP